MNTRSICIWLSTGIACLGVRVLAVLFPEMLVFAVFFFLVLGLGMR